MRRVGEKKPVNNSYYVKADVKRKKQVGSISKIVLTASIVLLLIIFALAFMITYNMFNVEGEDSKVQPENQTTNSSEVLELEKETQDDVVPEKAKDKSENSEESVEDESQTTEESNSETSKDASKETSKETSKDTSEEKHKTTSSTENTTNNNGQTSTQQSTQEQTQGEQ